MADSLTADELVEVANLATELERRDVTDWCEHRLSRLLRYGRKNSGGWDGDEGACEHVACVLPDDMDAYAMLEAVKLVGPLLATVVRERAKAARLQAAIVTYCNASVHRVASPTEDDGGVGEALRALYDIAAEPASE